MFLTEIIKATPGYQIIEHLSSILIIKVGHKFFAIKERKDYQIISRAYKEGNLWRLFGELFINKESWSNAEEFINNVVAEQLGAIFNDDYKVLSIKDTVLTICKQGYTFTVDTTPTTSKHDVYTYGKRALDGPKQVNFSNLVLRSAIASILYKGTDIKALLRVADKFLESVV